VTSVRRGCFACVFLVFLLKDDREDSGQGEIGAVGHVVEAAFLAGEQQHEGDETGEDDAGHRDVREGLGAEPEAERCDELDVATADAAPGEDREQQENDAARGCREQMVQQAARDEREQETKHGEWDEHAVKDHMLLPVRRAEQHAEINDDHRAEPGTHRAVVPLQRREAEQEPQRHREERLALFRILRHAVRLVKNIRRTGVEIRDPPLSRHRSGDGQHDREGKFQDGSHHKKHLRQYSYASIIQCFRSTANACWMSFFKRNEQVNALRKEWEPWRGDSSNFHILR